MGQLLNMTLCRPIDAFHGQCPNAHSVLEPQGFVIDGGECQVAEEDWVQRGGTGLREPADPVHGCRLTGGFALVPGLVIPPEVSRIVGNSGRCEWAKESQ